MVSVAARKKKKNLQVDASNAKAEAAAPSRNTSVYLAVGALLLVVSLCYANALSNGFVFDDHGHVLSDRSFRSLKNIPRILVSSYRPLRDVTYAVDFAIWGERAFGFHLTSILIHLANVLLVFWLIRRMIGDALPAVFASLIFALQPVQADSVTYISGRRDVLFSFFFLLSFHFYLSYRESLGSGAPRRYDARTFLFMGLFLAAWALSLMSKEMAASLPVLIFVWSFCDVWKDQTGRALARFWKSIKAAFGRDKWFYALIMLALPAYVWYQVILKGGSERVRPSGVDYWGGSFYANLLTSIRVHAWYLKQLVFPTPIVQYSGGFDVATSILEWRVIVSIIVVGATLAAGFVLLNKDRLLAFAILSFFALLLPVSQLIPHHELLADHYLYLPMMSFGLFAAVAARKIANKSVLARRLALGTAAALVVAFGAMIVLRNAVYKDDFTLWKTNYEEVPNSLRAVSSLAGQYATRHPARSAELYKRCIEIDPSYAGAYVSLAALYQTRDKAREAEELIEQGLTLPDSRIKSPAYKNPNRFRSELTTALAISKGFQGSSKEAEALLLKAIDLYPLSRQPYVLLTTIYRTADREKELEVLKKRVDVFPNDQDALMSLSYRLIEDKSYDEALPYLDRILSVNPNDFYANYQYGQIYRTKNDCSRAGEFLNLAKRVASSPEDTKNVGDALSGLQLQCSGSEKVR
ncbi:MAG TPA: hypothetical protein VLM38_20265 [Blastocatellia bacterium]|nr:hypothetical protein [Blastocatellia bacterium]